MRKVALLSLLMLLVAVPAFAAPPNYFVLKGGIYSPGHEDLTAVANGDFDIGFNGEVAFGHYFTPNIAVELGAGYLATSSPAAKADIDAWAIPILLSVKAVAPFPQGEIYALAGVGAYLVEGKHVASGLKETDTAFGFQVGIGGNYSITPEMFIGLEGKYFWAKASFPTINVFDPKDVHFDGFQGTVNLGFRF